MICAYFAATGRLHIATGESWTGELSQTEQQVYNKKKNNLGGLVNFQTAAWLKCCSGPSKKAVEKEMSFCADAWCKEKWMEIPSHIYKNTEKSKLLQAIQLAVESWDDFHTQLWERQRKDYFYVL